MKMRSLLPSARSRHAATPRWTKPVPNGGSAFSPVFHSHATESRDTFDVLTSVSVEYFVPPGSPPYTGHSTIGASAANATSAAAASEAQSDFNTVRVTGL